jgi:hypothetical protein
VLPSGSLNRKRVLQSPYEAGSIVLGFGGSNVFEDVDFLAGLFRRDADFQRNILMVTTL